MNWTILYTSKTGSCKKYAQLLGQRLDAPVYEASRCPAPEGRDVIHIGWAMAGKLQGYGAAAKRQHVRAAVQVGMSPVTPDAAEKARAANRIPSETAVFCLQGGFELARLPLFLRLAMVLMDKKIVKMLREKEKTGPLNAQESATLRMAETGRGEPADWNGIDAVAEWAKTV